MQEEVEDLRGKLAEAERNNRGLERARRNLGALTSKQQRLIEVLEKQKVSWDKFAYDNSYLSLKLCQPGMKCIVAQIVHMLRFDAVSLEICGFVFIPQQKESHILNATHHNRHLVNIIPLSFVLSSVCIHIPCMRVFSVKM